LIQIFECDQLQRAGAQPTALRGTELVFVNRSGNEDGCEEHKNIGLKE